MKIQATSSDSKPLNLNPYSVNYLTLDKAQADHETAYYNMEKILPFYNKELLVYYGNKIAVDDKLNKVRLLDVVPMKILPLLQMSIGKKQTSIRLCFTMLMTR